MLTEKTTGATGAAGTKMDLEGKPGAGRPGEARDFVRELGPLALGSRMRRLSDRMMGDVTEIYRKHGLPFEPRWLPLFRFLAAQGAASTGEAAEALGVSHAAVSQVATQMRSARLLTRRKDPADERRTVLSLTDGARELLPRLDALWGDFERVAAELVSGPDGELMPLLSRLERRLEEKSLFARVEQAALSREQAEVEILPYRRAYRKHFASLNLAWLEKYFSVEPIDREVLGDPEGRILALGGMIFFARCDGQIVGTVALRKEGDAFELTQMAVSEASRGRQVGTRLMEAALEAARAAGASSVHLYTNDRLLPAVRLYRKFGFKTVPSKADDRYARTNLFMRLRLRDPGSRARKRGRQ